MSTYAIGQVKNSVPSFNKSKLDVDLQSIHSEF